LTKVPNTVLNIVWNWGAYFFSVLVNFFLSPFVVHHLGDSAYGVWVLMVSLVSYLGFLDFGVRGAVTRYVSKFHARGDHDEASRISSSALSIFAVAGAWAIAIAVALAYSILDRFHIPPAFLSAGRLVLLLAGVNMAVTLIGGAFGGILAGLQRFDWLNAVGMAGTAARAVATVVALSAGHGLVALAWIQLFCSLGAVLASAWAGVRFYPQLRIRLGRVHKQQLALILSFSAYSFLFNLSAQIIYYADAVLIGAFLPVGLVTFFSIAGNLILYARSLVAGISYTMTPLASSLEARDKHEELQRTALDGPRYATILMLPIVLTFLLRGNTFIGLWMGPSYAEPSGRVLWILSLAMVFSAGTQVASAIMFGISQHKLMVPVSIAEALCNLGLSVALVRRMGISGVAWGTTLPNLAASLFFWPWYMQRTLKISLRAYVTANWLRPFAAIAPFAVLTYALDRLWPVADLLTFFWQVAVVLPSALLGNWYLCLTPWQRQTYSRVLVQFASRVLRKA
jgi:O-antigen/teichoic acid export membrane protein